MTTFILPGSRLRSLAITMLFCGAIHKAAVAQNTFTTIRLDSGSLPIPEGCEASPRLAEVAQKIRNAYPKLLPGSRRLELMDFVECNSDLMGDARTTTREWPDGTVAATVYVGQRMVAQGQLRVAVIIAHELAHIGNAVVGEKPRAGPDGHGYSWMLRLIRAGLPSVAYEQIGPGGAFPQYADAYRRASLDACRRNSCGPELVADSGLDQLFSHAQ